MKYFSGQRKRESVDSPFLLIELLLFRLTLPVSITLVTGALWPVMPDGECQQERAPTDQNHERRDPDGRERGRADQRADQHETFSAGIQPVSPRSSTHRTAPLTVRVIVWDHLRSVGSQTVKISASL